MARRRCGYRVAAWKSIKFQKQRANGDTKAWGIQAAKVMFEELKNADVSDGKEVCRRCENCKKIPIKLQKNLSLRARGLILGLYKQAAAVMVRLANFPLAEHMLDEHPDIPAFLLTDHEVVALGDAPISAEYITELIEETARAEVLKSTINKLGL